MGERGQAERIDASVLDQPELVEAWRELALLRSNPFLTPEWFRAWAEAHPADRPFILLWRRDDRLRGVLPLVRSGSGRLRVIRFAGARWADWLGPACAVEDERAMAADCAVLLGAERSHWHLLEMARLDSESAWPRALWEAPASRIAPARPRADDVLPCIRFGAGGHDEYMAGRSRNFRSQMGRRRRKLEREHGLEFRLTTDPASLDADLETFFELHEERWRRRGGSAAVSAESRQLHRRFAAAALEHGWLRLWTAIVDGEPGACWYGWRIGERYCYSLSGLREAFEPLGLGSVLLAHTIAAAAAEGAAIYDLLRGDEPYKKRFETDRREAGTWMLGRRRHPVGVAHAGADRLAAQARRLPPGLREPAKRAYRIVARP